MVGVVFVQLPTTVGPLGLGVGGLVVAWLGGLALVAALPLWMNMRVRLDDAERGWRARSDRP